MPRPPRFEQQQAELLPILAHAFGELGYRRMTTAELARRCGVRENILYRHWKDKSAMFIAALDYVHDLAIASWTRVINDASDTSNAAERLLDYEAQHLGEFGNYRIIFSALGDTDNPEIRRALRRMYRGFFRAIRGTIEAARCEQNRSPDSDRSAWAMIGLGTIATILGELDLLSSRRRADLLKSVGRAIIAGQPTR